MPEPTKTTRTRSPEHPAITLEEAIRRTEVLYNQEHYNQVPAATVLDHWGYRPKSGLGQRILAALRHYGLLEEKGSGDQRVVWLSENGKVLALKERDDPSWIRACQEAALAPAIHRKLWDRWGENGQLPSDSTIRWELVQLGFNPKTVQGFTSTFRATLEFANLLHQDDLDVTRHDDSADPCDAPTGDDVGQPKEMSQQSQPMPSSGAIGTRDWDLTIPLMSGERAILRVPIPLSEADFQLVKAVVNANLDALKASITRKPARMEDPGGE